MGTPELDSVFAGFGGFGLEDVLEIAQRRWRWLAFGLVAGLILGCALWWALPRRYEATTTILVEPQGIPESYVRSTITLAIEHRIRTLGERVTGHANLNALIDVIGPRQLDPSGERSREGLMGEIRENLAVSTDNPSENVAVVEIRYEASRPEIVADVVREIANLFIAENRKDRARQAASTSSFLEAELVRIRMELTQQEKRIQGFRAQHLGALPSQLETNLRELDRLNESLAASREAEDRLAHQISQLKSQRGVGDTRSITSSNSRAAALSEVREALIQARRVYTEEHPNVVSLRSQIERMEQEIGEAPPVTEADRVLEDPQLQRDLETLTFTLQSRRNEGMALRERIAELQKRVEEAPRNEQALLELTRDYDTMKQTYRLMLGNKHDASLAQNLEDAQMAEQFKVLRPARTPTMPFSPDPFIVVPAGLGVGLFLAALAIILAELRRPAFHSPETLARRLGLPIFASIPDLVCDKIYEGSELPPGLDWRLVVAAAPNSAAAEQYRGFLPHFLDTGSTRVILVTSAQPGDGKSVTTANLACTLATLGRSVLLIDADLRRGSQHRLVHIDREPGLSDLLQGETELGQCVRSVFPNLSVVPSGRTVDNPHGLLTDETFLKLCEQARENYEVILIDSPPILPVIDAKILRRMADMVVFVVRAGVSPSGGVVRSLRELRDVAGVVFNRVSVGAFRRYYYYDAYSKYEYADAPASKEAGDRASTQDRENRAGGN